MNLSFRAFQASDRVACSQMMNTTWKLSDYKKRINSARLLKLILSIYERQSDYKEVALLFDKVVGFLFSKRNIKKKTSIFTLKTFFQIITGYFGNPIFILRFLHSLFIAEKKLFNGVKINLNESSEIIAFFVDDKARGAGVGTSLLDNFFASCKDRRTKKVFLITDTDCNYLFYEKKGFDCLKKHPGIIGLSQDVINCKGTTFLYSKEII